MHSLHHTGTTSNGVMLATPGSTLPDGAPPLLASLFIGGTEGLHAAPTSNYVASQGMLGYL